MSLAWAAQVSGGPIKTVKRMLEKVKTYGEEARSSKAELSQPFTGHVLDPIRTSVICNDTKELLEVCLASRKQGAVAWSAPHCDAGRWLSVAFALLDGGLTLEEPTTDSQVGGCEWLAVRAAGVARQEQVCRQGLERV